MKRIVIVVAFVVTSLSPIATSARVAHAEQIIGGDCGGWIGWAEYRDFGDNIKIRIRPTKRAWIAIDAGTTSVAAPIWDAYFNCIGWDDGFDRLSQYQWNSLWLQHRCHLRLGLIGRLKSGDTFDYESWHPNRGDLWNAMYNGCN